MDPITIAAVSAAASFLYFRRPRQAVGGSYHPWNPIPFVKPAVVRRIPANHTFPEDIVVEQLDRVIQPGHSSKVKN